MYSGCYSAETTIWIEGEAGEGGGAAEKKKVDSVIKTGRPTGRRSILLWTNSMGRWSDSRTSYNGPCPNQGSRCNEQGAPHTTPMHRVCVCGRGRGVQGRIYEFFDGGSRQELFKGGLGFKSAGIFIY